MVLVLVLHSWSWQSVADLGVVHSAVVLNLKFCDRKSRTTRNLLAKQLKDMRNRFYLQILEGIFDVDVDCGHTVLFTLL